MPPLAAKPGPLTATNAMVNAAVTTGHHHGDLFIKGIFCSMATSLKLIIYELVWAIFDHRGGMPQQ